LYNEWFEYFHKEKPVKPGSKQETERNNQTGGMDQTFAERMAHDYQMKQYEDLSNRWYAKALLYSEKVRVKLFSVLKFPMGGWMIDIEDDSSDLIDEDNDDEAENSMEEDLDMDGTSSLSRGKSNPRALLIDAQTRSAQLLGLRKFYLPNICFVLTDMLGKMNQNKELIRLTDLVASENYRIYELFEKAQLRSFLNKVANASINLLDSNIDYLGYN
jgi:hypothetical protein